MNRLVGSCNCTLSYWISVIFISFFLLFPVSFLSSQTFLRQDKDCILGNEIQVKKQVGYIDGSDGLKGLNVLWDFSTWKTINENYTIKSFNTGLNSVSKYEHRTFYDYQLEDDTLFLCGYKNSTAHVSYPLPEVSLIYPLGYGDSISSYFYGVGNYSSRVGLKVYGKKRSVWMAWGHLFSLPVIQYRMLSGCIRKRSCNINSVPKYFWNPILF